MSKITELFGHYHNANVDWRKIVEEQNCPFLDKKCIKVRKSQPDMSIGTCVVSYGKLNTPIIICPHRFRERFQVFFDCLHLLTQHEPGNELHIIPEISVPGGNIDYFLVSSLDRRVRDFVAIEVQTLDTTGTLWPERQRFLQEKDVVTVMQSNRPYGMNWKMTAKTILVQLHHKIQTLERLNKHLVLVVQNSLLEYMNREFQFTHIKQARLGDSMQFHAYDLILTDTKPRIQLARRLSTNTEGIARCLGLQAETKVELEVIKKQLEAKISDRTLLQINHVKQ